MRKISGSARQLVDVNAARALKEVTEPLEKLVDQGATHVLVLLAQTVPTEADGVQCCRTSRSAGAAPAKPRLETLVNDISETTRLMTRRAVAIADGLDPSHYSVSVAPTAVLGQPIVVRFTAPASHPAKDWVGLYYHRGPYAPCVVVGTMLGGALTVCDTALARSCGRGCRVGGVTTQSSQGRWRYLGTATSGELVFSCERLPLLPGRWEARLHNDNHHGIVAVSAPFDVVRTFAPPKE